MAPIHLFTVATHLPFVKTANVSEKRGATHAYGGLSLPPVRVATLTVPSFAMDRAGTSCHVGP